MDFMWFDISRQDRWVGDVIYYGLNHKFFSCPVVDFSCVISKLFIFIALL